MSLVINSDERFCFGLDYENHQVHDHVGDNIKYFDGLFTLVTALMNNSNRFSYIHLENLAEHRNTDHEIDHANAEKLRF